MCVFNQILNLFLQRALRQYYIFIFVFFYGVYVLENCIARLNILHLCVTSECMRGYIALLSDFRFGYIFTHTYTSHNTYTIYTHTHIRRLHTYVRTEHTHATLYTFHLAAPFFLFSRHVSPLRFSSLLVVYFSFHLSSASTNKCYSFETASHNINPCTRMCVRKIETVKGRQRAHLLWISILRKCTAKRHTLFAFAHIREWFGSEHEQ